MRRSVTALLLIATLHVRAVASPPATGEPTHDRDGRPRASSGSGPTFDPTFDPTSVLTPAATTTAAAASPWIDEAPTPLLDPRPLGDRSHRKRNSVLILGGLYAGFIGWTYLAWYRKDTHEFRWGGDVPDGGAWYRWFDTHTYAAGADKLGHAWATLGLARAGTELLNQYGGYSRLSSAIVGTSLSQALFLGVEIKDGFAYSFSIGDFAFNTAGAVLAFAQSMWPRVDEFVDHWIDQRDPDATEAAASRVPATESFLRH